jgi:hypothetical protein
MQPQVLPDGVADPMQILPGREEIAAKMATKNSQQQVDDPLATKSQAKKKCQRRPIVSHWLPGNVAQSGGNGAARERKGDHGSGAE